MPRSVQGSKPHLKGFASNKIINDEYHKEFAITGRAAAEKMG
jgi:hypothetical protein